MREHTNVVDACAEMSERRHVEQCRKGVTVERRRVRAQMDGGERSASRKFHISMCLAVPRAACQTCEKRIGSQDHTSIARKRLTNECANR
jgi:hypothetical protein